MILLYLQLARVRSDLCYFKGSFKRGEAGALIRQNCEVVLCEEKGMLLYSTVPGAAFPSPQPLHSSVFGGNPSFSVLSRRLAWVNKEDNLCRFSLVRGYPVSSIDVMDSLTTDHLEVLKPT